MTKMLKIQHLVAKFLVNILTIVEIYGSYKAQNVSELMAAKGGAWLSGTTAILVVVLVRTVLVTLPGRMIL